MSRLVGIGLVVALGCAAQVESNTRVEEMDTALAGLVFNKNLIYSDEFFRAEDMVTASQIQSFLEHTNYGRASWLASERVGSRRVSDVLIDVAHEHHVNPIMLVARIQVEQSGIARTSRPPQSTVDKLFGCGCPDNRPCAAQYRGLANQLSCAGEKLDTNFRRANRQDGLTSYGWHPGVPKSTLDRHRIVPVNAATAALYAYTPWTYAPSNGGCGGGNCAVQSITRRVMTRFYELGVPMSVDVTSTDISGSVVTDPIDPPAAGSCSHSLGGVYAHLGCSASYQCDNGSWKRITDHSSCVCEDETGRNGCSAAAPMEPEPMEPEPMEPEPMEPEPMEPEPTLAGCTHSSVGGSYPHGGCTRSSQCDNGRWVSRAADAMCTCTSDWGSGCS